MTLNLASGAHTALAIMAYALLAAYVLLKYLTEYGDIRKAIAAIVTFLGIFAAIVAFIVISKHCKTRKRAIGSIILVTVITLGPLVSMAYPGRITYSRFGLTIYGIIPVPVLDITVNSHGVLWFRDKSHFVTLAEVQPLLRPDVEMVIIGTGWHSAVSVEQSLQEIEGYDVRVLPTPEAIQLFNECVSEGKKVVFVAHSTC